MASTNQTGKGLTIRPQEELYEAMRLRAFERRISMAALVLETMAEKLGLPVPGAEDEAEAKSDAA